ncbi:hypothetical protein AAEX63_04595 [Luteococcus sp. H138]|uniref:hypothetical protein n=1 Tax=unclassified Luteococcus TaxID=2639923 RepID=UPI00313E5CFA
MLDVSLRLATTLNRLASGRTNAPDAEQVVRGDGTPHHVVDPDGLLGLDPLRAVPLRLALARLEHGRLGSPNPTEGATPVWALLLPRPGRPAGLRGPADFTRAALECESVVLTHDGTLAWLGERVGGGVQWRLARADRPLPPPDPRECARQFSRTVAQAASVLSELDLAVGARPGEVHAPVLGEGYPSRSQTLLDRAWLVLLAVDAALASQHEVLHSHAVLTRERHLRELADAALDAISAATSWPEWVLEV